MSSKIRKAIKQDRVDVLQTYTIDDIKKSCRCPCGLAAEYGSIKCLEYLHQTLGLAGSWTCTNAASQGHLECLQYAHEHGFYWGQHTCTVAAAKGHLACLQYAHEHGCEWSKETTVSAAGRGQLECLQYAHEQGCDWDEQVCANAASGGYIECLQYAHEHGCRWNRNTCSFAAEHGHLECLKYAHEHGCEWDVQTLKNAAQHGHFECLKYAYDNLGLEYVGSVALASIVGKNLQILDYVMQKYIQQQKRRSTPFIPWKPELSYLLFLAFANAQVDCFRYLYQLCIDHCAPSKRHKIWTTEFQHLREQLLWSWGGEQFYMNIDLDDAWWREQLFCIQDLSKHPTLLKRVTDKKQEIREYQEASFDVVSNLLTNDVIHHILFAYI